MPAVADIQASSEALSIEHNLTVTYIVDKHLLEIQWLVSSQRKTKPRRTFAVIWQSFSTHLVYIQLKEMSQDRAQWRRKILEWSSAVGNPHRGRSTSEWVSSLEAQQLSGNYSQGLCLHTSDCRLSSDGATEGFPPGCNGDASAVHRNPCWGLRRSVWLRTGSLWCENLGNIPLWLPHIP